MSDTEGGFRDHLCTYVRLIQILFMACSLLLVMNTVSLLVVSRESPAFVIVVLNFVALIPITAGTGYMIHHCRDVPL